MTDRIYSRILSAIAITLWLLVSKVILGSIFSEERVQIYVHYK